MMEIGVLIRLCKKYQDLGGAMQEQLDLVMDDRIDECNPRALAYIEDWLYRCGPRVEDAGELREEINLAREEAGR